MSAFVQHAGSGAGRQFPLFVVVVHPPRRQLAGTAVRAVSEYPFSKTLPALQKMQKPAVFTAPFAERFASPSLRSGEGFREGMSVAELSLIHHHNPRRFGKQPKHPQKIGVLEAFFVDAYGMGRIKLLSLFKY